MSGIQTLDIISVNIWQILISFANLLILFLIVKRFLFKPVQRVFAERKAQVQQLYDDAQASRGAAEQMKKSYEVKLASARAEADTLVRDAVQTAQRRSDEMLADASSQASRMRQKADEEIAREKKQMLREVRDEIGEIAVGIAEKVIEREINGEDHQRLVNEFIRNVGEDS